jgi:transcriptional regulator with XRE-family HTH domain
MRSERLRLLRKNQGYSQGELADAVNIGERQIWRYENEETEPDGVTVARIARVLETSTDYLLGLTDDPTPHTMQESDLTKQERAALSAWRRGDIVGAIKVIVSGE